jgi:transposase
MKFDFSNAAPKAETLYEAQQIIEDLWGCVAVYEKKQKKLHSEIAELKEKLKTNSSNSSKPPSSDPFRKKEKKKQHGPGKGKKLKQGAQPGHKGKGRKLLPLEEVDDIVVCLPEKTCSCGGHIQVNPEKIKRHQQLELPVVRPVVTEYQQVYGVCKNCGSCHQGKLPEGIAPTLLAPRATATVGILSGDYHLGKRAIQQLLGDFFNLNVSLGTISNSEQVVSNSLREPVEEAQVYIQKQPVLNADETSHKLQGGIMWMWLATTLLVAVFIIRCKRSGNEAKELLGEKFAGIVIIDRHGAYNWIKITCRQFCWSHLKRDFQKISERSGKAGKVGDEILDNIRRMFVLWHRLKEGKIKRKIFREAMKPLRKNVERLLKEGTVCGQVKTENTCKRILKNKEALWTFVDNEGVEPTNNLAEQQIRSYVLWRRSSFGTQSLRGNRFVERMMTVTATCKLQKRNRYDYITTAVSSYLKNEPAPSLLPENEKSDDIKHVA